MAQFHDYETYQWYNHQYQDNSFSNTYDFDWRDHPNVYDQYYENQNSYQNPSQNNNLEKMMHDLMTQQTGMMTQINDFTNYQRNTNTEVSNSLRELNNMFEFLDTKTSMLETQIAQQASSSFRQQGTLPGKPESNSREHDHAMAMEVKIVHEEQSEQIKKESSEKEGGSLKGQESDETQKEDGRSLTKECESTKNERYIPPQKRERYNPHLRLIFFSQDSVGLNLNDQIDNFANHIRQPKIEKMPQMPNLTTIFSEFSTNQSESENTTLNEENSENSSYDLPLLFTLEDPESFSSLYSKDNTTIEKPTFDFEANEGPLPKEIVDQLESGNFESTNTKLILEDGSIQSPLGVLKNVVFKNEKIKIPADFVIIENEKGVQSNNLSSQIILTTADIHNNVKEGKLSFFVGKKKETFCHNQPNTPSTNKNSAPLVKILQVDNNSLQGKSVATSETDKTRESNKMNPVWYSTKKYINMIRNYKKRRKKKKVEPRCKTKHFLGGNPSPSRPFPLLEPPSLRLYDGSSHKLSFHISFYLLFSFRLKHWGQCLI